MTPDPPPVQNSATDKAPSPPVKDPLRPLRRRAAVAWAGGALSLGLLWGQDQARVLHPHGLLFLFLVIVTFAAGLGALARGLWRLARGPRRAAALAWALAAVAPALLYGLLGAYAASQWRHRHIPHNLPFTLAKVAGASLMEAQAAYLYPHRLETERLVMFYGDGVADPQGDAEAMDQHLARMEALTGKPLRAKVHWVRGSLLGMRYLSFYGLALGSTGRASPVDRHELAHAVLYQQYCPDTDPPALLVEGWAESQANDSQALTMNALKAAASTPGSRDQPEWHGCAPLCVRELTGPAWYHQDSGPVYGVGGAFVDFLLRRYGAGRFLDLYFACRPGTFAAECQRVYGTDADSLERQFWADVMATLRAPAAKARGG